MVAATRRPSKRAMPPPQKKSLSTTYTLIYFNHLHTPLFQPHTHSMTISSRRRGGRSVRSTRSTTRRRPAAARKRSTTRQRPAATGTVFRLAARQRRRHSRRLKGGMEGTSNSTAPNYGETSTPSQKPSALRKYNVQVSTMAGRTIDLGRLPETTKVSEVKTRIFGQVESSRERNVDISSRIIRLRTISDDLSTVGDRMIIDNSPFRVGSPLTDGELVNVKYNTDDSSSGNGSGSGDGSNGSSIPVRSGKVIAVHLEKGTCDVAYDPNDRSDYDCSDYTVDYQKLYIYNKDADALEDTQTLRDINPNGNDLVHLLLMVDSSSTVNVDNTEPEAPHRSWQAIEDAQAIADAEASQRNPLQRDDRDRVFGSLSERSTLRTDHLEPLVRRTPIKYDFRKEGFTGYQGVRGHQSADLDTSLLLDNRVDNHVSKPPPPPPQKPRKRLTASASSPRYRYDNITNEWINTGARHNEAQALAAGH